MKQLLQKTIPIFLIYMGLTINTVQAQQEGIVTIKSSPEIDKLIQQKRNYNKDLEEVKGFKIQLFNGSEQGAYKMRDEFSQKFPETAIKIEFFSPEWKVRVGNYKTRLEADKAVMEIKEEFPGAIVLPAMIKIK